MALATTTVSSAVGQTDTSIVVASATSMAAGRIILVDQELMQATQSYVSGTTVPVLRGRDGTAQVAHKVTANVTHGLASDFANPGAQAATTYPTQRTVIAQSITATSTLTLPSGGTDLRLILNGTSVITLTIPVPTKDMDYTRLSVVSNGVAAHVLTITGGVSGAGSGYTTWTFNSSAPAAAEFMAANGLWMWVGGGISSGTTTKMASVIS